MSFHSSHESNTSISTPLQQKTITKNLVTYLLTYLRNNNNNNNKINNNKKKLEGHTTQLIYNKEDWLKFKHILDFEGTNPNRLFWTVVEIIIAQFDQKEFTLDKYLSESDLILPDIEADPVKICKYMQSKDIEYVKQCEDRFTRCLVYAKAITQGETDFSNYVYLWRKYNGH